MERLTKWFGSVDNPVAGMDPEHEGKYNSYDLIHLLLDKLARYEDTGLTPDQIKEMCEYVETRMLQWFAHKYGIGAGQMMGLAEADREGRLWEAPCKMGTTLYMVVTKRPKINWPEFSFIKTTCLTEHNFFRVIRDFGKTVFLFREDAEEALAKLKEVQP